ncbi:AMP-dependent synthetase/ligase [Treponema parvum]|uniref:AMP-dependent synthetase/ligase n=1 Tax=Treponema parvum TaxID=138851 RepID=UPI001AEBE5F8|nr:long-chain fatty acid--CoA ligase [Treponema parvum]QTQ16360.1 long-chain fatty acid--CoA ligase [Treponema parvum]
MVSFRQISQLLFDKSKYDMTLGKSIPDMLRKRVAQCPNVTLQAVKNEVDKFDCYTYERVYRRALDMACQLKKMGIKHGDRVGLIADNRREWMTTDYALLSLGAIDVPRGCDSTGQEIRFILNFTECKFSFFENAKQFEKILEKPDEVPCLKHAILFDSADSALVTRAAAAGIIIHNYINLEEIARRSTSEEDRKEINDIIDNVKSDDIATIIFTSGTTGIPKGVMLTHDNFLVQCQVIKHVLPDSKEGDLWLSVLPVWHVFERAFQYFIPVLKNGCVYSKPVAARILADMAAMHPQWMCSVPRLWDAIAKRFFSEIRKKGSLSYAFFNVAVSIGKTYWWAKDRVFGLICRYRKTIRIFDTIYAFIPFLLMIIPNAVCDLLVFRKIRAQLGGKMSGAISGGGSLQAETDAFYHAIGFKLLEGYGLTETAPVLSLRNSKKPRSGCVGEVMPCAEIKVVAEKDGRIAGSEPLPPGKRGLILARGRQVMKGYYKRPDLTESVIDKDGWFNTGDLGMLTQDNEIKITGRAKDTIVLLGGENVEPQVIENAVCSSKYIETAVVVGQDQKYIAALIVPIKDSVLAYAEENRVVYESYEGLLQSNEIISLIRNEIDSRVNAEKGFRACERIFKFTLLEKSFTVGEEINSKMEKMRHKIVKIYARQMKKLYE